MNQTVKWTIWTALGALGLSGCGASGSKKTKAKLDSATNYVDVHTGQVPAKVQETVAPSPSPGAPDPGPAPKVNAPYPQFQLTIDAYPDCQALQDDVRARLTARRIEEKRYLDWQAAQAAHWASQQTESSSAAKSVAASGAASVSTNAPAADAAQSAPGSVTFTNVQEKGVDEADTFKIGDHQIYTLHGTKVEVVSRQTLAHLGQLDLSGMTGVTLYAEGDRLLALGRKQDPQAQPCANDVSCVYRYSPPDDSKAITEVRVYDAPAGTMATLTLTRDFPGKPNDSRLTAGRLILVLQDYMWVNDPAFTPEPYGWGGGWQYNFNGNLGSPVPDAPVPVDAAGKVAGVPCGNILKQEVQDFDYRMTKIISLDVTHPDQPEQATAILGGGDQLFMALDALYVAKQDTTWYPWTDYDSSAPRPEQLVITRIKFDRDTGAVTPEAAGVIDGHVKDQWAFEEYADAGVLSVATSTGILWDHTGANVAQNHLWILKPNPQTHNLDVAASLRDFGSGEDIRAVRYVNKMAYIVTFKKTDPLFAIDLTDPLNPKELGELKMPGFSVYLHPVSPTLMVGLGFDAADQGDFAWFQGLQVSLYDVSDPQNLKRVDNKILGSRGSYSDATGDHHAFFFDAQTMTVGMPVVQLSGGTPGTSQYGDKVDFSGAIIYGITPAGLTEKARLTHNDLVPDQCKAQMSQGQWWQTATQSMDINRIFEVDGKLLTLSRFGIKAYDPASPGTLLQSVAYATDGSICPPSSNLN